MGNKKRKILEISKLNCSKSSSLSHSNFFLYTKKQSKIDEAELKKWLQNKDPWNQDEFDILTKD